MDQTLRLLLVDDDEVDRYAVKRALRSANFDSQIEEAATSSAALDALQNDQYDCVLLDYILPPIDGLTLLKTIRSDGNSVPIIILTGQGDEQLAVKLLHAGASDYLAKDKLSTDALSRSLRHVLHSHQLEIKRQHAEKSLRHLATHDSLTDLPNRVLLKDRLQQALINSQQQQNATGILFVDLDRFKMINDSLGHAAGDTLLKTVSTRLAKALRIGDTVARWGGDEFVIVLANIATPDNIAEIARHLLAVVRDPIMIDGQQLFVTASIGGCISSQSGTNTDTLLRNANTAMHCAKQQGRDKFIVYTPTMNANTSSRLALETDLRYALDRQELALHYQPLWDLNRSRAVAVEALLRWQHSEKGLLNPHQFLAIAEETGLSVAIGEWVLHTACANNRNWQQSGLPPITVAVNLSDRQFRHPDLVANIRYALQDSGLAPQWLEIELTEDIVMHGVNDAIQILQELRALGIKLSIDDFGTGYSSLAYLKRFPLDTLKIDRSFIKDILTDPHDATIVAAVVAMAHKMKLNVVAEGVENEQQLNLIRQQGCNHVQGYFISKPISDQKLMYWLTDVHENTAVDRHAAQSIVVDCITPA